jgi:alpha-tubulin suppressor-like RCC1 family protein
MFKPLFSAVLLSLLSLPLSAQTLGVRAGSSHSLLLQSNGSVWAWGLNSSRQLGDGTAVTQRRPVPVTVIPSVVAVSGGASHTLAIATDGRVWAWGDNYFGQLGDGTTLQRTLPIGPERHHRRRHQAQA